MSRKFLQLGQGLEHMPFEHAKKHRLRLTKTQGHQTHVVLDYRVRIIHVYFWRIFVLKKESWASASPQFIETPTNSGLKSLCCVKQNHISDIFQIRSKFLNQSNNTTGFLWLAIITKTILTWKIFTQYDHCNISVFYKESIFTEFGLIKAW